MIAQLLLAAIAATTAYAGPCKPQSHRLSTIPSLENSIAFSTSTASILETTENTGSSNHGTVSQEATTTNTITSITETATTDAYITGSSLTELTTDNASTTETVTTDAATTDISITDTTTEAASTKTVIGTTDAAFDTSVTEPTTDDASVTETVTIDASTIDISITDTTTETISTTTVASTTDAAFTDTTTTQATANEVTTTETTTAAFCSRSTAIILESRDDPAISPFCVDYLSMSTETITKHETIGPSNVYELDLATVTADAVTNFETAFDGVTVVQTVLETKTEWDTSTITRTRSTDTISCLNGAYTYTPPVVSIDRVNAQPRAFMERSGEGAVEVPDGFPDDWTEVQTSEACSCLSLDAPTTTTTIFQTVEPTTFLTVSTDVVTPIEEYTKVITTTSVSTFTSTVTEKRTSTVTGWVVETTFASSNGVTYRRYDSDYNAVTYSASFTPAYFKSRPVLASGSFTTFTFNGRATLTIGSETFGSTQSALLFNGYFFAKESGIHTFVIPPDKVDNWGYLWVGNAAYAWNSNTWVIEATRTGSDSTLWKAGSHQVTLNKGDAIPLTYLWANGGGRAGSDVSVRTPSGMSVPG